MVDVNKGMTSGYENIKSQYVDTIYHDTLTVICSFLHLGGTYSGTMLSSGLAQGVWQGSD